MCVTVIDARFYPSVLSMEILGMLPFKPRTVSNVYSDSGDTLDWTLRKQLQEPRTVLLLLRWMLTHRAFKKCIPVIYLIAVACIVLSLCIYLLSFVVRIPYNAFCCVDVRTVNSLCMKYAGSATLGDGQCSECKAEVSCFQITNWYLTTCATLQTHKTWICWSSVDPIQH